MTCDSCFSGKLCLTASKMWLKDLEDKRNGNPRTCKITNLRRFKIDASAEPNKQSMWGRFTEYKKLINSGYCTNIEHSILTNNYIEEFGIASFNSRHLNTSKDDSDCESEYRQFPGILIRTKRKSTDKLKYDVERETEKWE